MRSDIIIAITGFLFLLTLEATDAKKLRIHIGTWNVNSGSPSGGLEELSGLTAGSPLPDVIVIGMQEITMRPEQAMLNKLLSSDKWTRSLVPELAKWGYESVKTVRLVGIMLSVFVHVEHSPFVSMVAHSKVPTGFGGLYGNKGAAMIGLDVYDTRLRFVNAHLPAHDNELKRRIEHYSVIKDALQDLKEAPFYFLFGDLNFRLEDPQLTPEWIRRMVDKDDQASLLPMDQLKNTMENGVAFNEFKEMPINFKPTFKMIPDKDDYNMKRRPAWTDRILYKPSDKLEPVFYTSLDHLRQSDHRPVVAQFIVDV